MSNEIERRLSKLEEATTTPEPERFVFPFGTFDSPAEAHAHPAMGRYIEERRQQAFHSYKHEKESQV